MRRRGQVTGLGSVKGRFYPSDPVDESKIKRVGGTPGTMPSPTLVGPSRKSVAFQLDAASWFWLVQQALDEFAVFCVRGSSIRHHEEGRCASKLHLATGMLAVGSDTHLCAYTGASASLSPMSGAAWSRPFLARGDAGFALGITAMSQNMPFCSVR